MPASKTAAQASPSPATGAAVERSEHQRDIINRLRRIEGQVRALAEMVDRGRPCEDIAQQMSAARKAMDKAFYRMMACSMLEAVTQGDSIEGVERSTRILEKYA
ncbi:metal-sensitive transcriptional regulator [Malikia sp.]|uniref:metal-sensitive transcriptional regulator n=1 Tax=Malikia sp. TaxID=2070706 RepID=UPI002616FA5E|nr:metal-sensitive transcriptional regulator [Malikia sp.]MDD2729249.1 metal-sensitive transcriptional regulator [Malikia sp.]